MTRPDGGDTAQPPRVAKTREFQADGRRWLVRESTYSTDRRSGPCLIFDAETVIRRVRQFPADWHLLSDDELYALSLSA